MKGGKLSSNDLYALLKSGYDSSDVQGYILDKDISTDKNKVFYNPTTQKAVIVHRGTKGWEDWSNNAIYAIGGVEAYKNTQRYKEAETVQNKAIEKYGANHIATIGHSQGGLQAELLGYPTYETITYNKPNIHNQKIINPYQYDIRTERDPISYIGSNPDYIIPSTSYNPVYEHSLNPLTDTEREYGRM